MKNTRKFLLAARGQSPSSLRRPKHVKTSAISEVLRAELPIRWEILVYPTSQFIHSALIQHILHARLLYARH